MRRIVHYGVMSGMDHVTVNTGYSREHAEDMAQRYREIDYPAVAVRIEVLGESLSSQRDRIRVGRGLKSRRRP